MLGYSLARGGVKLRGRGVVVHFESEIFSGPVWAMRDSMNKDQRAELLRQRFYAKHPDKAFPREPSAPRRPKHTPKGWINVEATYPLEGRSWEVRAKFLKQPDAKETERVRNSRITTPSHLTLIACKWRRTPITASDSLDSERQ